MTTSVNVNRDTYRFLALHIAQHSPASRAQELLLRLIPPCFTPLRNQESAPISIICGGRQKPCITSSSRDICNMWMAGKSAMLNRSSSGHAGIARLLSFLPVTRLVLTITFDILRGVSNRAFAQHSCIWVGSHIIEQSGVSRSRRAGVGGGG